jgi:tetratricopeptide (TPR) repeat protein
MRSSRFSVLAVAVVLTLVTGAVSAQPRSDAETERVARTHFAAGEYREARDLYARLYADTLHPTYLRNIGRCYQNLRDPDRAITSFEEYLRKAKQIAPADRAEVEGYIRELEALKRRQEAQGRGDRALPATAPVRAAALDPTPAGIALAPSPGAEPSVDGPPFYKRWWFWTAVGLVVAAGAAGVAAGTGTFTTRRDAGCSSDLQGCK